MSLRLAVFASGGGTNLQALIDAFHGRPDPAIRIVLVISDRRQAGALARAQKAGIEATIIPVSQRPVEELVEELLEALSSANIDLILLAGYLRLIPAEVVRRYRQRIINIHPALLPAFGGKGMFGLNVHRAVLQSGATLSGATVHMVDECFDEGMILAQWPVPVLVDDSPERLAERVLHVEHLLYPATVEALARSMERGASPEHFTRAALTAGFVYRVDEEPQLADIRQALGLE